MKKHFLFVVTLFSIAATTVSIYAETNFSIAEQPIASIQLNNNIDLYTSDVIEYKYRYNTSGRLQYRRWNKTKSKWVDTHWINC